MINKNLRCLSKPFIPFLILGTTIALIFAILIILYYILLWGLIIGAIMWFATIIKNYFFVRKIVKIPNGRVIDHMDQQ